MHIGENGNVKLLPNLRENIEPLLNAGTAIRIHARSIGLVKTGLKDIIHAKLRRKRHKTLGEIECHRTRLNYAWTCDKRKLSAAEDDAFIYLYPFHHHNYIKNQPQKHTSFRQIWLFVAGFLPFQKL